VNLNMDKKLMVNKHILMVKYTLVNFLMEKSMEQELIHSLMVKNTKESFKKENITVLDKLLVIQLQ